MKKEMKKEMKVSPFFDREYLKRAETREDRERLLQNIEWVSMGSCGRVSGKSC